MLSIVSSQTDVSSHHSKDASVLGLNDIAKKITSRYLFDLTEIWKRKFYQIHAVPYSCTVNHNLDSLGSLKVHPLLTKQSTKYGKREPCEFSFCIKQPKKVVAWHVEIICLTWQCALCNVTITDGHITTSMLKHYKTITKETKENAWKDHSKRIGVCG